ncbi:MAG: hypothetical protein ACREV4_07465 [Gammaproteobacteria bacterium]
MTLSLAAVHTLFGIYGLSGAGIIPRLIVALLAIGGMYAFRGLSAIEQAIQIRHRFRFASSSTPSCP